jgi:uncharacterized membrane protein
MSSKAIPRSLFSIIALMAIAQSIHDFPLLPDRMASHFAASGAPNGWMSKPQFFIVFAIVFLPALFVEFWLHRKIEKTPGARINLPNKEFWMAPERRAETFAYFESFFAWYGCAFLFVMASAMSLAMRANFNSPPQLAYGPIVSVLVGFALYNVVAISAMFRRFSNTRG